MSKKNKNNFFSYINLLKIHASPQNFINKRTKFYLLKKVLLRILRSILKIQSVFNNYVIAAFEELNKRLERIEKVLSKLGKEEIIEMLDDSRLEQRIANVERALLNHQGHLFALSERIENLEKKLFKINFKYSTHGAKFFSQFGEDLWIKNNIDLPKKGFFIDVGAGDGVTYSNTFFFELIGWDGICIEPNPYNYSKAKIIRKKVISCAIASRRGAQTLFIPEWSADWSSLKNRETNSKLIKVKTLTLNDIVSKFNIKKIDLLSIDTEGTELDVLKSLDFKRIVPKIIIVEYLHHDKENSSNELKEFFKKLGCYKLVHVTVANLIYIAEGF